MSGSDIGTQQPAPPEASASAVRVQVAVLKSFVQDLLAAQGLTDGDAETAAHALVTADVRGVWSHGVVRAPMYCERLERGVAKARPSIQINRVATAAALMDGDDGLGLIVAPRAMDEAIDIARQHGIGLVGVKRSGHFGMAALYAQQAIDAGCIGLVFTNASPALPPWGARKAFFGTSPLAFGAPTGDGPPFLVDMAMSTVARGKLKFAAQRGEAIPPGLALDAEGRPTTDGAAAFSGVMLPFGGVKGAALSWMMDVFCGVFTGAAMGGEVANPFKDLERPQNAGHVFIAIRADLFMPLAEFIERMNTVSARAKALPLAEGFDRILSPGEPEALRAAENKERGVPLTPDVLHSLQETAKRLGVPFPLIG